jgi:hypothetical protein
MTGRVQLVGELDKTSLLIRVENDFELVWVMEAKSKFFRYHVKRRRHFSQARVIERTS